MFITLHYKGVPFYVKPERIGAIAIHGELTSVYVDDFMFFADETPEEIIELIPGSSHEARPKSERGGGRGEVKF